MTDRALFVGFGAPVRGREERAIEVFGEFVEMFGRMQADGRIAGMDVTLLDPHGLAAPALDGSTSASSPSTARYCEAT